MEIEVLHRQGNCIREIAQEMGIARNTVRAIFARRTQDQYDPREPRPSKLDPYKPHLHERLEEASKIELHATVLLREIQARGYDGGITQLKEYLRLIRPTVDQVPVIRFETEPGKQLQIDFVVFRRGAIETLAASWNMRRRSSVVCPSKCCATIPTPL